MFSHFQVSCQLEENFEKPKMFMPERWLRSGVAAKIHPFTLLPFGFGNRMCAGRRFSELELYLATAKVVLNYRLLPVNSSDNNTVSNGNGDDEILERTHAFIVIPAKPMKVKCISRL